MRFETPEALANHQKKFCQGSSYQDVQKLELRLQELGHKPIIQKPNLNFQDVRNYLKGEGSVNPEAAKTLQNMNLDDLRNFFHSENQTFDEMSKQAMRARERELVQELEGFKQDKAELRLARLDQDRALADLAKELDLKKERETRAKLEKEQIAQALREIEQTKMSAMERDKRRELERLAVEREALRQREEEVIDEIRDIEWQIEQKQLKEQEDRQRLRDRMNDIAGMENPRKREIEVARQRGEQIALLQNKRDVLERDRKRIMDDLEKVKQGDMISLRKNEASRWIANDILQRPPSIAAVDISKVRLDPTIKDKLMADQMKITKLREMREKTLQDFVPENEELDPLTRKYQQATKNNSVFAQFSRTEAPNNGAVQQASPLKYNNPIQSRPGHRSNKVTFEDEALRASGNPMIEKLRKLREDYKQTAGGNQDPEFFAYLNDLENHIIRNEPLKKPQLDHPVAAHQPSQSFSFAPQQQPQPQPFYQTQQPEPSAPFQMPMIPPLNLPSIMPAPLVPQPQYIPPPPPQINPLFSGGEDIERLLQSLKPEPVPAPAQSYVPPSRKKEEIEQMDNIINEQAKLNDKLEVELENLKAGRITFDEFERQLNDPQQLEIDRTKRQLLGRGAGSLGQKRLGSNILPDDFKFRQNDYRAEDMEVEERALMNLAAQEFDELRILSKLPKNSDIYRHKMQQYKEMSAMRAEMEKLLQEQKLEKIRRDFERQKIEDQRKFKHDRWLEEQQKQLLEVKLNLAAQQVPDIEEPAYEEPYYEVQQYMPPIPQVQNPPPELHQSSYVSPKEKYLPPPQIEPSPMNAEPPPRVKSVKSLRDAGTAVTPFSNVKSIRYPEEQKQQVPPPPKSVKSEGLGDPDKYLPFRGFNIFFDFIARIQRQYRSMRIVYAVYNVTRALIPPSLIDIHDAEPDPEDPNEKNRIIFKEFAQIKNIQPHPSSTLILEIQVPKPNTGSQPKFVSYGWTLLNLFDSNYNFNRGVFKLPLYMSPTRTDIDIRDIGSLSRIPETVLLFRIGNPGDAASNFQYTPSTVPEDYVIPKIHLQNFNQGDIDLALEDIPNLQEVVPFNPQYQCKGARFYLHFMKYYVPQTTSRIQLTLYDGNTIVKLDDAVTMCNWASKSFDSANLMFSQPTNPMNQGLGITPAELARGEIIAIEDEKTWLKDFYKMQFNDQTGNKNNNDISLVVQVMEQKGTRNDPQGGYGSIAYGVFRINNQDGTIRYGVHDVPLFKPPINLTKRNPADLVKQVIKITIGQPTAQDIKNEPQQQVPQPNVQQPQIQQQPSQQMSQNPSPEKQPSQQNIQKPQQNLPSDPSDMPFIKNENPQFTKVPFRDGEGVDIYIDGARFLPENATFSRVLMRGFTIDFIRVVDPVKGLCDLTISTSRNPFYGFRYELRAAKLDPTIVIEVAVETIDRSDGLEKIIGYSYFPLFLHSQTYQQNIDRNQLGVVLQNGAYQLPIYIDRIPKGKNLTIENINSLEKIPCATVLLRCIKAPMDGPKALGLRDVDMREWKNVGVIVDPNDYSEGRYNTQYCQVTSNEMDLYLIKYRRIEPSMRQVAQYLMKLRGRNETLGDDEMMKWLDRILVTNQSTPKINLRYFSGYVPNIGFRFSVERLHGITQKLPHLVATSIAPPGSLYHEMPKLTPDVTIFSNYSPLTHWSSLQFEDDVKNFTGLPMAIKLGFVIDVKALQFISPTQTQPIDVGWSFLPIFSVLPNEDGSQSIYVNSGLFALPLFPGPVPKDIIGFIAQNQENLITMLKPEKNEKVLDTTSVIVRIHDNQREWIPVRGFYGDINYSYLPQQKLSKLAFTNEQKWNQVSLIDSAKSATPPSMQTRDGFMKSANIALSLAFGQ